MRTDCLIKSRETLAVADRGKLGYQGRHELMNTFGITTSRLLVMICEAGVTESDRNKHGDGL